jgi:hypothetical protein
MGMEQLLGA